MGGKVIAEGTVNEVLNMAGEGQETLTPVFLKLTGGERVFKEHGLFPDSSDGVRELRDAASGS